MGDVAAMAATAAAAVTPSFGKATRIDPSIKSGGNGEPVLMAVTAGVAPSGGQGGDVAGAIFNDRNAVLTLADVSFGGRSVYFGSVVEGGEAYGWRPAAGVGPADLAAAPAARGQAGRGGIKGLRAGTAQLVPPGTFTEFSNGASAGSLPQQCLRSDCLRVAWHWWQRRQPVATADPEVPQPKAEMLPVQSSQLWARLRGRGTMTETIYPAPGGAGGDPLTYRWNRRHRRVRWATARYQAGIYCMETVIDTHGVVRYAGDIRRRERRATSASPEPMRPLRLEGDSGEGVNAHPGQGRRRDVRTPQLVRPSPLSTISAAVLTPQTKPILSFNVIRLGGDVSRKAQHQVEDPAGHLRQASQSRRFRRWRLPVRDRLTPQRRPGGQCRRTEEHGAC